MFHLGFNLMLQRNVHGAAVASHMRRSQALLCYNAIKANVLYGDLLDFLLDFSFGSLSRELKASRASGSRYCSISFLLRTEAVDTILSHVCFLHCCVNIDMGGEPNTAQ